VAWEQPIYKSMMRLIDQQKELNYKRALSNVPLPSTMTATTATAADSNVGNLPMMRTSQQVWSMTLAVPHLPWKRRDAMMEEATMPGAEYNHP
jgi:hypothetical protein